jgi:hypothetical protein
MKSCQPADEQEAGNHAAADHVREDHDAHAIEPIDHDAGNRTDQRDRHELHRHHDPDRRGRPGDVEEQRVNGNGIEPVTQLTDHLTGPQEAQIPIAPQQLEISDVPGRIG